ncbi:hypothetical protein R1flu_003325 [Riccia fluitans]|uniref:CSD domain-containing protein n=1 Tax=Riccia fluitans TaxID=41844 RepID=A0ABD1Y990_9MARC
MDDKRMKRTGRVSMYRRPDGYGIITPDDGGREIFFHGKDCCKRRICEPGQQVSFFNERTKHTAFLAAHVHAMVARGTTWWSCSTHLCPCSSLRMESPSVTQARSLRACGICGEIGHNFYMCPARGAGMIVIGHRVPTKSPPVPRPPSKKAI